MVRKKRSVFLQIELVKLRNKGLKRKMGNSEGLPIFFRPPQYFRVLSDEFWVLSVANGLMQQLFFEKFGFSITSFYLRKIHFFEYSTYLACPQITRIFTDYNPHKGISNEF